MRTQQFSGAALAGIALVATAATPTHAASTVAATVSVVAVAPSAVDAVLSARSHKKPQKTGRPHKASRGRSKHAVKQLARRVPPPTTASSRTPPVVGTPRVAGGVHRSAATTSRRAAIGVSHDPRGSSSARASGHRDPGPLRQVTGAVRAVIDLLGWNLLAIIPMAGIAYAISRRIRTSRDSIR